MYIQRVKKYKAEYIWIDGTSPVPQLRSKTKILDIGEKPPLWNFDGSSCSQAEGKDSDCVLHPVFICSDPTRDFKYDKLVLCEVLNADMTPHETNTRFECKAYYGDFTQHDMWFGIEQEYTLFKKGEPLGFYGKGESATPPQGPYYCSVGTEKNIGREFVEEHMNSCLNAGLKIGGVNAEVMPGQWEFQIGTLTAVMASDELWVARYLLYKIAEKYGYEVSLDPKPRSNWNGAGAHVNFSTRRMRYSYDDCLLAVEALKKRSDVHISNYGHDIEKRLTGDHETCSYKHFKSGVSDRSASIRIPWNTAKNQKGYLEDRRPNANMDPYIVTKLILETVCSYENENK